MQVKITYGMVNAWNQEIEMWVQAGSIRMLFDAEKIQWFLKTYAKYVVEIQQKQNEFAKKYVRYDENKKPLPPTEEESIAFSKEMDEFMNTVITTPLIKTPHDA
jgi:hypothetical protein